MSSLPRFLGACALWLVFAVGAAGQDLTALARVDAAGSSAADTGDGAELVLALSQPVPWRAFTLDAPRRLVMDFSEVDWRGLDPDRYAEASAIERVVMGQFRPGWSRMVLELAAPYALGAAEMTTEAGRGLVRVRLEAVSEADFAASAGAPESARFKLPEAADGLPAPRRRPAGTRPVMVVIDPGHGGIDPGAERGGVTEADLMLTFARELKETLLRTGGFRVLLTRDDDIFVPLEMRLSIARAAQADAFISLHADALAEGRASGATVYTLSDTASDVASQKLAERHDRADLLAGVDLARQDDRVALLLMDLARTETAPRSDRLADALVAGLEAEVGGLHKRPRLEASFSVLKAADIPSVLVELGFLSNAKDRDKLTSAEWREKAAAGLRDGLVAWARADAAEAALLRR